jgi:preprotein translocase subunit SecD
VDANVLIYERIREEQRAGRGPISALDAGFQRALTTIVDSNLTTLIAGILLFEFGSGPIKGFAVTLSLGILTSMFTALMVTRLQVILWMRRVRPKRVPL